MDHESREREAAAMEVRALLSDRRHIAMHNPLGYRRDTSTINSA